MPDAFHAPSDDAPIAASKTADPDRALLEEAVTIGRPAAELYEFWRDQTNLVGVMENVVSIERIDDAARAGRSRRPAGKEVSWESVDHQRHSRPRDHLAVGRRRATSPTRAAIRFEDAGARGTVVRATIAYDPPGGTSARSSPSCSSASRASRRGATCTASSS